MLGGAYFRIDRIGGYGKRSISFRAFPYPPFNVRFSYFPTNSVILISFKPFTVFFMMSAESGVSLPAPTRSRPLNAIPKRLSKIQTISTIG